MTEETETPKPKRGRPPRPKVIEHPQYQDPISVDMALKDGTTSVFHCVDYDTSGSVWRFKSFPPERGRQTVRLISASEVSYCRIDEPEKAPVPMAPTTYPWVSMDATGTARPPTYGPAGPQHYVAKDHLANTARGGLVNGIPQSVAKDENGNETVLGAAMLPPGAVS